MKDFEILDSGRMPEGKRLVAFDTPEGLYETILPKTCETRGGLSWIVIDTKSGEAFYYATREAALRHGQQRCYVYPDAFERYEAELPAYFAVAPFQSGSPKPESPVE